MKSYENFIHNTMVPQQPQQSAAVAVSKRKSGDSTKRKSGYSAAAGGPSAPLANKKNSGAMFSRPS